MIRRFSIIFFLLSFTIMSYSQYDLSGKYWTMSCGFIHGYFLRLLPDSTAHFTPIFEDASDYFKGIWSQKHDTIIIEFSDTSDYPNRYEYFLVKDSIRLEKIHKTTMIMANILYRQETYYPNGDIKYKFDYEYSVKDERYVFDGRQCYYHPKKRIKTVVDYKNGDKHGIEINYSSYGYLSSYGKWRKGKKIGEWIYYDSDFNLVGLERYSNGKLKYETKIGACFPTLDKEIIEKLYMD